MAQTNNRKTLSHEDLYINLEDTTNKRKNLLLALKNSLIVQEEADKLKEIREEKILTQKEIKKNIEKLQEKYLGLKKLLPSVRGTLSMTEKEIHALESHITTLKNTVESDTKHIAEEEYTSQKLKDEPRTSNNSRLISRKEKTQISKVDRIKNNLNVIEEKLKNL